MCDCSGLNMTMNDILLSTVLAVRITEAILLYRAQIRALPFQLSFPDGAISGSLWASLSGLKSGGCRKTRLQEG
jgi:hypothetical protein